jgi:hypothetical protein
MILDPGRRGGELAGELLIDQEAFRERVEVGVGHTEQDLAEPGRELGDVLSRLGEEVFGLDPVRVDDLDVREDDLKRPLEDLGLAANLEVVARLERAGEPFAGVPEPGANAPGLVAEFQVEVKVALTIGPELLVGDQVSLVNRITIG